MTPFDRPADVTQLVDALRATPDALDVMLSTAPVLVDIDLTDGALVGPVKLFIDEHSPPDLDSVIAAITSAHSHGRTAAVHAVTSRRSPSQWRHAPPRYGHGNGRS